MVDKINIPPTEPYFSSEDIEIILEELRQEIMVVVINKNTDM